MPRLHHDDEIGILVRSYNRNQQLLLRQQEELNTQVTHFPGSELPNKAFLMALLEHSVARQSSGALLIISCDTLRDTAGVLQEAQREMLLLTLVEKLKSLLPSHNVLAQVSASEFAIIALGVNAPWQAVTLGKQVLTVINERVPLHGIQLRPNANIGVVLFNGHLFAGQLYHRAASAVASAQRKGKNQIQFFEPEQMEQARQWLAQESELLAALDEGRFALWLQPQIALASGELSGAEASLQLRQADGSGSTPEDLKERIAASGLTADVSYWMLEEACRLLAGWQSRGVMLPLTVNLFAEQLMDNRLEADLPDLMQRYGVAPQTLLLNVFDSRQLSESGLASLRPLREAGVRVALDNLGLPPHPSLPVDVLKIDNTLIERLPDDSRLVGAIIALARSLDVQIVADGVQNEAQQQWLADAGVDVAQGDLFGRALPTEAFETRFFAAAQKSENT